MKFQIILIYCVIKYMYWKEQPVRQFFIEKNGDELLKKVDALAEEKK